MDHISSLFLKTQLQYFEINTFELDMTRSRFYMVEILVMSENTNNNLPFLSSVKLKVKTLIQIYSIWQQHFTILKFTKMTALKEGFHS